MTHIEPFIGQQVAYRGLFNFVGTEVELVIETLEGKELPSGKWPSFEAAVEAAKRLEPTAASNEVRPNSFAAWTKKGYYLLVVRQFKTGEWWVVAGKGKVIEDTGARYKEEAEARKAAGLCA